MQTMNALKHLWWTFLIAMSFQPIFRFLIKKQVELEFFNDRNVANVQLEFTYSL